MKRPIIVCCALALGSVSTALANNSKPPTNKAINTASAASAKAAADARIEAAALARSQERAVATYKRYQARAAVEAKRELARAEAAQAKAAQRAKQETHALARAHDRAVANYKRYASRELAAEKIAQDKASAVAARSAKEARQQAAALSDAYDRALASHKRVVSRRLAAEKVAQDKAAAAASRVAKLAKQEAAAVAAAQDRVVAYYRRSLGKDDAGPALAVRRIEKLACFAGIQDRHARIGVQLVDGKIDYFAYYSKWKPRTCSILAERNGPYSRWEDNGTTSKVILVDDKGSFTIDRKGGGTFRFVFHDIDRMRYCGMSGKINGSLTVVRGKSTCVVEGVMDGHEG